MNIEQILTAQRSYFQSGVTLPVCFRIEMLKKLRAAIQKYETEIAQALKADLGKSEYESYMCEVGLVVTGGRKENAALLELGGKSPCMVDSTAKIKLAAKRIICLRKIRSWLRKLRPVLPSAA